MARANDLLMATRATNFIAVGAGDDTLFGGDDETIAGRRERE